MNEDEQILLLLQIIRVNGNSAYLLSQGYTVLSLSKEIDKLQRNGYITINRENLFLTKKGEDLFHKLNKKLNRRGLYKYLNINVNYHDIAMPLDEVYVPPIRRVKREEM